MNTSETNTNTMPSMKYSLDLIDSFRGNKMTHLQANVLEELITLLLNLVEPIQQLPEVSARSKEWKKLIVKEAANLAEKADKIYFHTFPKEYKQSSWELAGAEPGALVRTALTRLNKIVERIRDKRS